MSAFGVAEAQVRRTHAVSHILATLSRHHQDDIIFFGGTGRGPGFTDCPEVVEGGPP
jgi:hypothetical protein